ncbi:MAG: protein kinase, partial [Myxococcales bacterium]|nr:protein kinase [Myxococcales bacterium]
IVQVFDFGRVKQSYYIAMEFVDGLDLGRLVSAARRSGRRLPPSLCAYLVSEVSKGLDYAHNRKDESGAAMEIVHRDVSPQNVLCSYDGIVKIADFGIARARLVSEETGVIKGKFSYMSPEQARGQRVDRRSDVYSLGILLAELLMNRPMYPGQQGMEVLEQVREGRRTLPRSVDKSVPAELDEIIRRATSLDREQRFQSARSLAAALTRWLHVQDEVLDAVDLEQFIGEVAPREVTSPDGTSSSSRGAGTADTHASLPHVGARELRERRNVVVVHGRFRGDLDDRVTGVERTSPSVDAAAVRVLEDIAFKYHAILDWPEGTGKRSFRLLIGLGRVSVDDPLHATRMAMDVLDALLGLSADLSSPLEASIGLSRGVVATVRAAAGRRLRYQPVDGVFEVARELGDQGDGGEILATGEVYRLARRAFSFDEEGVREITVSGTQAGPRRFRAYRLRGARTRDERASEARAMAGQIGLFGRSHEIKAIVGAYDEAVATAKSSYLCVLGELGAGKSALVAAALAELDPPPRLLRVECLFGSSEVPYEAVAELVREACGIKEDSSGEEARARLAKVLRKVVRSESRSADLEALEPLIAPQLKSSDDSADHSAGLNRAVRHLLGGLAATGPLVVWVDALQFVDAPSLSLMARLMASTYEVPLMVIVSSRQDERVEELLGSVARIDLAELDDAERRALITARFGGAVVPNDIHQAIVHRAG